MPAEILRRADAVAGGGNIEGIHLALALLHPGPPIGFPDEENLHEYGWGLRKYVNGVGLLLQGRKVRRSEVITYVANKLGGAHLDLNLSEGSIYTHLFKYADSVEVLGKNAVYAELLSIGQLVATAPDIQRLVEGH